LNGSGEIRPFTIKIIEGVVTQSMTNVDFIKLNFADLTDTQYRCGNTYCAYSLERMIAHEMGHAVMGAGELEYKGAMDNVNQNENEIMLELAILENRPYAQALSEMRTNYLDVRRVK
jgi:hypothetical protein